MRIEFLFSCCERITNPKNSLKYLGWNSCEAGREVSSLYNQSAFQSALSRSHDSVFKPEPQVMPKHLGISPLALNMVSIVTFVFFYRKYMYMSRLIFILCHARKNA